MLNLCLFVDFEKAFDTVPRSEMLNRCRALGMHGAFLGAITAMYDNILMAVKAQGSLGPTFATTQGTKQGGELSPLLFGLFIEQLHELLLQQCPGMGPVIGGMHVPDILYADDVVCMSTDPEHVQHFLDALELFCTLFGMRVNTGKTYIVIFRAPSTPLPAHIKQYVWRYKGQAVATRADFKYLGAEFHSTKGLRAAGTPLAKAGSRAMHALLTRLRAAHISQSEFQVRLFGVLVEPVLSYGCQVWGPDMFGGSLHPDKWLDAPQEAVQLHFLRFLCGLPKAAKRQAMLREFGARPLHLHWLALCARFWARVLALPADRLLRKALVADIELFVSGCQDCWSAKFLLAMQQLQVVTDAGALSTVQSVLAQPIDEKTVADRARRYFDSIWDTLPADPAHAPSSEVVLATYHHWVCGGARPQDAAPHMRSPLNRSEKACLCRLRIGSFDLGIHTGRFCKTPRPERICKACTTGEVEDLPHFLLRCPAHAVTRAKYADIYKEHATHTLLAHSDQRALAQSLLEMLATRQAQESV